MQHSRSIIRWCSVFGVLAGIDVFTRHLCFRFCVQGAGWFGLHPFPNKLFAFSVPLPAAAMYVVYAIVAALVGWLVWQRWREAGGVERGALLLIASGGGVNIAERLWLGYVRDFIQVWRGYYNLGDIYILAGICLLLLSARSVVRAGN